MRKIYPPPFNKFAIFVLYGLLSIIVITLAGGVDELSNCDSSQIASLQKDQVTIGYVHVSPNQPDPKKFPWDSYNYINVIGKKKNHSFLKLKFFTKLYFKI